MSGEHSDPDCSSQGNFSSFTNETVVSMPGDHWSWRWSHFAATLCHLHLSDKLQPLEYHLYSPRYNLGVINLSFWSFRTHNDCSKCGQTSRPFVEAKVQARCNTEASSCSCFLLLVKSCFGHFHVLGLGYKHRLGSTFSLGNALYRYLTSFLHHHIYQAASTSSYCAPYCAMRCSPSWATNWRGNCGVAHSTV